MTKLLLDFSSSPYKFIVNSPAVLLAKLRQKNLNSEINEKELRENLIWLNTPFSEQNTKMIGFLSRENELITFFYKSI